MANQGNIVRILKLSRPEEAAHQGLKQSKSGCLAIQVNL